MPWFYYDKSGAKVGPIRTQELKALAQQGVITPETVVENADGRTAIAGKVNGLEFSLGSPVPPSQPVPAPVVASASTPTKYDTVSYKCQNCGSPLVIEPGQDRAICKYCRSQNVITFGADGSITLLLVEKVDAIDTKADQILAMQKAASMGHLLATMSNEHQHFLQNEYKPRMVMLEEERDKIGKYAGGCSCGCLAVSIPFCLILLSTLASGDGGVAFTGLILFAIAAGLICAAMYGIRYFSSQRRQFIQEKMDALTQKKADFEKQIGDIKKSMSS